MHRPYHLIYVYIYIYLKQLNDIRLFLVYESRMRGTCEENDWFWKTRDGFEENETKPWLGANLDEPMRWRGCGSEVSSNMVRVHCGTLIHSKVAARPPFSSLHIHILTTLHTTNPNLFFFFFFFSSPKTYKTPSPSLLHLLQHPEVFFFLFLCMRLK